MALKVLNLSKEIITTPFSYVATTNAILWENCKPVFVDINKNDFCINAQKIEAAITDDTEAILATHVYGYPCDVEAIEKIAAKYNLKIIYDAAHAFAAGDPRRYFAAFPECNSQHQKTPSRRYG